MQKIEMLKYVKRQDIDTELWERCLASEVKAKVYPCPWYLDAVAEEWHALIFGDYHYIMPLPVNRKMGFTYVAQPAFTQQLGIFPTPPPDIQQQFASKLKSLFRLIDYQANHLLLPGLFDGFGVTRRRNRVLCLPESPGPLPGGYSENTRRNIRKAKNAGVTIFESQDTQRYINLVREHNRWEMNSKTVYHLGQLMNTSLQRGAGKLVFAADLHGSVIAGAFWVLHNRRAYFLNTFSTPEGKEKCAAFALVAHFCHENSGSVLEIDFEGSEHPGVDRFYAGFGATEEYYFLFRYNSLPPVIKWLKKWKE